MSRLYELEYGHKLELFIRLFGTFFAALLIYLYTGWGLAWVWCFSYFLLHLFYFWFLRTRKADPSFPEVVIGIAIFLFLYCLFIWMPTLLVMQQDEVMKFSGGLLMACVLIFLIRRAENYPSMAYAEIGLMAIAMTIAMADILSRNDSILAKIALPSAGIVLIFYLTHTIKLVRSQRHTALQAAERSVQAQKMEAIGQLAGGVAHDFNNLLTAVIGNLELYNEIQDPNERAELIANAKQAAERGANVVKMLLHYSRQSDGNPKCENVSKLLSSISKLSDHLIPSNIKIIIGPSSNNLWVRIDESQITAALMNLISNSADAIEGAGTITLSATKTVIGHLHSTESLDTLKEGTYVEIKVLDTGCGIQQDILSRVIDPFFTTKPKGKGSGLGLSMVSGLAKRSGGQLLLESSPKGTAAPLILPFTPPEAEIARI